ncbi:histidine phosphatase family protein [Streptomyces roseoverticillatus]|uniref:histidine phosphatase family protein n=1 Tax=Streptomyces roseoverticillatus TaxID=66429 RepID=UPI001F3D1079|nr:histidine phosphatase family protein [Streptomyces roseoverticillatus]MCF3103567.1 histidine phosphatase family protein [Streptomyces roseoverticillatus]
MTVRVMLISPAAVAAHEARFGDDGPLDATALRRTKAAGRLPAAGRVLTAPSPRCRETAAVLGADAAEAEPALRDLDAGRWRGRELMELGASEPEALAAWLTDPDAAPHGGESVRDVIARVGGWLDGLEDGRVLAVAAPAAIRAAVVHGLALPAQSFWRLDVQPLSLTELTGRGGRWNLRCGVPLTQGHEGTQGDRGHPTSPAGTQSS